VARHWFRSMVLAVSVAVALGACSVTFAAHVSAASGTGRSIAATPPCPSNPDGSLVNPLDGTAACAGGPTNVEQRYEAAIAGAGLLAFVGATLIYRRRHRRGPRGLGPRAPQG
jgi:hypothetical protein